MNTMKSNTETPKTMSIGEVFRTLVGTQSECFAQLEELYCAGRIDARTFREAEAFYEGGGELQ